MAKGFSRQHARGHKRGEHKAQPKAEGGYTLSSTDRAFLAEQRKRAIPKKEDVFGVRVQTRSAEDRFARAKAAYLAMTPDQRAELRAAQRDLRRRYVVSQRNQRRAAARARQQGASIRAARREAQRNMISPGGGAGMFGDGGGGGGAIGTTNFDIDHYEGMYDDFPDLEDDIEILIFYHDA